MTAVPLSEEQWNFGTAARHAFAFLERQGWNFSQSSEHSAEWTSKRISIVATRDWRDDYVDFTFRHRKSPDRFSWVDAQLVLTGVATVSPAPTPDALRALLDSVGAQLAQSDPRLLEGDLNLFGAIVERTKRIARVSTEQYTAPSSKPVKLAKLKYPDPVGLVVTARGRISQPTDRGRGLQNRVPSVILCTVTFRGDGEQTQQPHFAARMSTLDRSQLLPGEQEVPVKLEFWAASVRARLVQGAQFDIGTFASGYVLFDGEPYSA